MLEVHGRLLPPSSTKITQNAKTWLGTKLEAFVDFRCLHERKDNRNQFTSWHNWTEQLQLFKQKKTAKNLSERFPVRAESLFSWNCFSSKQQHNTVNMRLSTAKHHARTNIVVDTWKVRGGDVFQNITSHKILSRSSNTTVYHILKSWFTSNWNK